MKIKVITEERKRDYRHSLTIEIDGKQKFYASDGEPEDATLMRDFNDCYVIVDLMKLAYEAGKCGEEFVVENEEINNNN